MREIERRKTRGSGGGDRGAEERGDGIMSKPIADSRPSICRIPDPCERARGDRRDSRTNAQNGSGRATGGGRLNVIGCAAARDFCLFVETGSAGDKALVQFSPPPVGVAATASSGNPNPGGAGVAAEPGGSRSGTWHGAGTVRGAVGAETYACALRGVEGGEQAPHPR